MAGIYLFLFAFVCLLFGYSVAFTFAGTATIFGFIFFIIEEGSFYYGIDEAIRMFSQIPNRIYSIMNNKILIAVPLFIFMGTILQRSTLAQRLIVSLSQLCGSLRGGLAISTIVVGSLLAASMGIVGASVISLTIIALPVMLKNNYNPSFSAGIIAASGTLGQLIPPSIILIILGDVFNLPVGDLFNAAIIPGMLLVSFYILFVFIVSYFKKDIAPKMQESLVSNTKVDFLKKLIIDVLPALLLILVVLGSILTGIATPTESASVGVVGSVLLGYLYKSLTLKDIFKSARAAVENTAMIFAILIGATIFSLVFTYTGGEDALVEFASSFNFNKVVFLLCSMLLIFILGFFLDFVEISYIILPLFIPFIEALGLSPLWYAILIAINLQTSFLTPPFGFSLFYLKGAAKNTISMKNIYKGVIPFIFLQILVLLLIMFFPETFGFDEKYSF